MEQSPEERIKELEAELSRTKDRLYDCQKYVYVKEDVGTTITLTFLLFAIGIGLAVALHMGWKIF